ncbi:MULTISPECIES: hypothetical protein [Legionella]|uniref:hypothetical protein n=1 Tax=Legionella TaxID=445 RepID=UPI00096551A0|nr:MULTISPECIES: hypothetical protein [Legionella]MBN9228847.1 DotI/IcmL/TraM family protein [Legionella steelei]OJW07028.1 MAG: hypothetical protein BGO44_10020 [Legionella sp. 39-23]
MKSLCQKTLIWFILFLCPLSLYAQDDAEVCQWVKKILLNTLSIDYNYKADDDSELRKNYTKDGWNALSDFLGNYINVVREQQLTLHPVFTIEPFVTAKGIALKEIHYWRVNEVVSIPELKLTIAFSLLVIEANPTPNGHFLIQSMDMIKKDNS